MKKTYINPDTQIVEIEMQALLQDSVNMGGSKGEFNAASGSQLSRERSSWDDED